MVNEKGQIFPIVVWVMVFYFGLVLLHMSLYNAVGFSDITLLVMGAVGGGTSMYGIVAIIANVREGRTWKGILKEIKKIFKKAFR